MKLLCGGHFVGGGKKEVLLKALPTLSKMPVHIQGGNI
uniref:Uncharacterized protein n=1 Tax=Anguilla anguilla TaxID=7936 RepID=A0A0E9QWH8_ANGAN